ncbi:MAG: M4 family metallopeptidase, partial [Planctomycetes bacterium]|nr:M4 family metallopeptidase [Planctomycetota bacterium]
MLTAFLALEESPGQAVHFKRGDANADTQTDLTDAVVTLQFLFLGLGELPCRDAADSNDDGEVDVTDPIHTLTVLFLTNEPLPKPGKDCGEDPTLDKLDCKSYRPCAQPPQNLPPQASFTASPSEGNPPLAVNFDASASSDPDGAIASYSWDFGDGQSGTGLKISHTYISSGAFPVTLTVTDDQGAAAAASSAVVVLETGPANPSSGLLEIFLAGGPIERLEAVLLRLDRIEVQRGGAAWETVSDTGVEVDLLDPAGGLIGSLGTSEVASGHFTGIRLALSWGEVIDDGQSLPLTFASEAVFPASFDVAPGQVTTVILSVDPAASLRFDATRGWILRPVASVASSLERPVSKISPAQRASLESLRKASLTPVTARFGGAFGAPEFLSGQWPTNARLLKPDEKALDFLKTNGGLFRLDLMQDAFQAAALGSKRLGLVNVRLQQTYQGVPVFGAELVLHLRNNAVTFVNGIFIPEINLGTTVPKILASKAEAAARAHIQSTVDGAGIESVEPAALHVYNGAVFDRDQAGDSLLAWLIVVRTSNPGGAWHCFVDAQTGAVIDAWDEAQRDHPSKVIDAVVTNPTSDDVLWYQDGILMQPAPPPGFLVDLPNLDTFGNSYYDYLLNTFGIDSIDGNGMRLVGRCRDAGQTTNGCFDCRYGEASFAFGWVTQDVVGHEFTHGLVRKLGGGLHYKRQSGALNESYADSFGEFLDCQIACNWLVGQASTGPSVGTLRDMTNPPNRSQPDHMDNYVDFSGLCNLASDNCLVHTNSGIPNKVTYLLAQGGTHYGISVGGLGVSKTEQLLFSTLVDSGLSSSASFAEYRDVMIQTCREMVGGPAGITSADCNNVYKAWCSVGFCRLTQNLAGGANNDHDHFGSAMASGDFNGDSLADLAIGVPDENEDGAANAGAVFVFYGTAGGLAAAGAEIITQSTVSAANEGGDRFGFALAAGDFNGDSVADLAIGAPDEGYGAAEAGVVHVVYGSGNGLVSGGQAASELITQAHANASSEPHDKFGFSLAAGNFNGDDHADLAVGAPYEDIEASGIFGNDKNAAGMVSIFYGSGNGLLTGGAAVWERLVQEDGGEESEDNDRFGYTLAAGNFNGDGFDDLAA